MISSIARAVKAYDWKPSHLNIRIGDYFIKESRRRYWWQIRDNVVINAVSPVNMFILDGMSMFEDVEELSVDGIDIDLRPFNELREKVHGKC